MFDTREALYLSSGSGSNLTRRELSRILSGGCCSVPRNRPSAPRLSRRGKWEYISSKTLLLLTNWWMSRPAEQSGRTAFSGYAGLLGAGLALVGPGVARINVLMARSYALDLGEEAR